MKRGDLWSIILIDSWKSYFEDYVDSFFIFRIILVFGMVLLAAGPQWDGLVQRRVILFSEFILFLFVILTIRCYIRFDNLIFPARLILAILGSIVLALISNIFFETTFLLFSAAMTCALILLFSRLE